MRTHIFFGTDGSVAARFAQAQILCLPWRPPVHVTAMTAMEVPHGAFTSLLAPARRAYNAAVTTLHQDARIQATEVLEKARLALEQGMDSVATRMHPGFAGPTIVDSARACRADLVVVGSRGLGMYKGYFLGSVSVHVAWYGHCSVMTVKSRPTGDRRFLVAVEGGADRTRLVGWLSALDFSGGARIHLLNVRRSRAEAAGKEEHSDETGGMAADGAFEEWAHSPEALEALGGAGLSAGALQVTSEVRYGQPVSEILDAIHEFRPELLVMGAKCPESPADAPLGVVTRQVVAEASCSVLVVRP